MQYESPPTIPTEIEGWRTLCRAQLELISQLVGITQAMNKIELVQTPGVDDARFASALQSQGEIQDFLSGVTYYVDTVRSQLANESGESGPSPVPSPDGQ